MRYLLLLLLLPLAQPLSAQPAAAAAPLHTILVRGTAEQELEPEKLDLLLTYRFSDNVKESGRTQEQEQSLQQVLKQAGIAPEKLVLEDLSASGYGGLSKTGNTNVALTKVYRLTLNNPKILNDLIPKLVQTGADNLRVVNLESSRLAATKLDVAARAVVEARHKADTIARQLGMQVTGVAAVAEIVPGTNLRIETSLSKYRARGLSAAGYELQEQAGAAGISNLRKIVVEALYDVVFEIK